MSETLEELGYDKVADTRTDIYEKGKIEGAVMYIKDLEDEKQKIIHFNAPYKGEGEIEIQCASNLWGKFEGGWIAEPITMEELKAIYKYCEDNKWIEVEDRYQKGYQDGFKQAKFDCEMDKLDGR